jgi:hypothetical protein
MPTRKDEVMILMNSNYKENLDTLNKKSSFKTFGEAQEYCERFGFDFFTLKSFEVADALKRAFEAGVEEGKKSKWIKVEDELPPKIEGTNYGKAKVLCWNKHINKPQIDTLIDYPDEPPCRSGTTDNFSPHFSHWQEIQAP